MADARVSASSTPFTASRLPGLPYLGDLPRCGVQSVGGYDNWGAMSTCWHHAPGAAAESSAFHDVLKSNRVARGLRHHDGFVCWASQTVGPLTPGKRRLDPLLDRSQHGAFTTRTAIAVRAALQRRYRHRRRPHTKAKPATHVHRCHPSCP